MGQIKRGVGELAQLALVRYPAATGRGNAPIAMISGDVEQYGEPSQSPTHCRTTRPAAAIWAESFSCDANAIFDWDE